MKWGMNAKVTYTLQNLINSQCWTLYLNWTENKVKDFMAVKTISVFSTAVHFFRLVRCLRNDSSYGG